MPKVSIIVPNHNHEKFLYKRLESIFYQTYQDFEVILLDDCSTDNSREILEEYRNHPKVTIIVYNEQNSGSPFKQWRSGVKLARGEYVWIAESDDESNPEFLKTLVNRLDKSDAVVLAYCQSLVIDEFSTIQGSMSMWTKDLDLERWDNDYVNSGLDECLKYLVVKNTIPNASAVVFKKNAFLNINSSINMRLCGDWLLWSRLIKQGDIAFYSRPLNYFRSHSGTVRSFSKSELYGKESLIVTTEIVSSSTLTKKERMSVSNRIYKSWSRTLSYRRTFESIKCLITMFKISPLNSIKLFFYLFFSGFRAIVIKQYF